MDQSGAKFIVINGEKFEVADLKIGDVIGDRNKGNGYQYLGGKGKWMNFKNLQTGEESVQNHTMTKISKFDECDHIGFWKPIDANGNIQCENCEQGQRIVWGKQIVKNGRIYDLKPKS
jgi:hypothetical protein